MTTTPWALVGLHASVHFTLVATADPGLLPRVLQPFARRDLVPDSLECRRSGETMRVDVTMTRMPAEMVHLVEGNLRQIVGTRSLAMRQEVTGCLQRAA